MNIENKLSNSLIIIFILGLLSIGGSAYKYLKLKSFNIAINVPCNELESNCFIDDSDEVINRYKIYIANYALFDKNIYSYEGINNISSVYCNNNYLEKYIQDAVCE